MIFKVIKIFLYCFLALTTLFGQNKLETGYPLIKNFTPKEHGADTQNGPVMQDDRGVLYFGNKLGLLEFDGADWRLYPMSNKSHVRSIALGENGEIYAGGNGDLGYYQSDSLGELTFHSLYQFIPSGNRDFSNVWSAFAHDGKVFFNALKYILIWDIKKKEFKVIQSENGFHVMFLVNSKVYVREWGKGLQVFENKSLIPVKGGEKFANEKIYVMLPFPEEEGTILICTSTMGMFKYDGTNFLPFKTEADQFIKDNSIFLPGAILSDGNILLGTQNGGAIVLDKKGNVIRKYNRESGITDNLILYTFQDRAGAIWLTTSVGISRIDYASPVSYFDSRSNFASLVVQLKRYNEILYVCTNDGLYYLDALTSKFIKLEGSKDQAITLFESNNELLAGTISGLYKVDKFKITPIRKTVGNEYTVNSIVQSKSNPNRIYLGARGLWSFSKKGSKWLDEGQILKITDIVNSIEEENNATLWLGTNISGAYRITFQKDGKGNILLDDPSIEKFDEAHGLQDGLLSVKKIDGENYFLCSENFYRFDESKQSFYVDNTYTNVFPEANYTNPLFKNIQVDNLSRLWISLGREPALGTPQPDGSYKWLTAPFKRFSNELIQSIYPEDNGVVWFSSNSNIIKYDLSKNNFYNSDYSALVRRVEIGADSAIYFGGKLNETTIPKIVYENNAIKFNLAAPSFEDKSANQFKTFLAGFEDDWSSFKKENTKEYTNLPPGSYTFRVIAKNVFEIESREASYSFEILAPWYRTWLAYFVYLLLLAFAIFLVDRIQRKRMLIKTQERMKIQEAEHRAETAELEARAMQAENERKTKELEEARQLQLSLLPKELPVLPNLDIAVYMQTATEVGGDYYDFSTKEDGSLNIALGDATGHGMKAGTLVSMMKSLFMANSIDKNLEEFFVNSNNALKNSKLGKMMMAFVMMNISNNKIKISNAGIPPVFIYQKYKRSVKEINLNGLPLGAMKNAIYEVYESEIYEGDTILLLSDGMPELQNGKMEMYGYERIVELFKQIGDKPSAQIVEKLQNEISAWIKDQVPDDDITFVVVQVK